MPSKEEIKHSGATFTPPELSKFLAKEILGFAEQNGRLKVLDPACGNGELLLSISELLKGADRKFEINGYELNEEYAQTSTKRLAGKSEIVEIEKCDCFRLFIIYGFVGTNYF